MSQLSPASITVLIIHYGFERDSSQAQKSVLAWLEQYDPQWVVWAIVEALYQRCSNSISIQRILEGWQRVSSPKYHFSRDFESRILSAIATSKEEESASITSHQQPSRPQPPSPQQTVCWVKRQLNPEVIPPAMVNHPSILQAWEATLEVATDAATNEPTAVSNDEALSQPEYSNQPPPLPEKIILDEPPSTFFYRLKHIEGS